MRLIVLFSAATQALMRSARLFLVVSISLLLLTSIACKCGKHICIPDDESCTEHCKPCSVSELSFNDEGGVDCGGTWCSGGQICCKCSDGAP